MHLTEANPNPQQRDLFESLGFACDEMTDREGAATWRFINTVNLALTVRADWKPEPHELTELIIRTSLAQGEARRAAAIHKLLQPSA
jgi:hypothetical protein